MERYKTHKIYDLTEILSDTIFTRDSTFSFEMKNGKKIYKEKKAELKIEKFHGMDPNDEGKRIGIMPLNLSEFIGKGLKYITFRMDKNDSLFLTVKISVIETNQDSNVLNLAMQAVKT